MQIIALQPPFSYSMPVQMIFQTLILVVISFLLIHLVFTVRYHWPVARLNFSLQLSAGLLLLLSDLVTFGLTIRFCQLDSHRWPYMFVIFLFITF